MTVPPILAIALTLALAPTQHELETQVPLVQSALLYAHTRENAAGSIAVPENIGYSAAFAATLLPMLASCESSRAAPLLIPSSKTCISGQLQPALTLTLTLAL